MQKQKIKALFLFCILLCVYFRSVTITPTENMIPSFHEVGVDDMGTCINELEASRLRTVSHGPSLFYNQLKLSDETNILLLHHYEKYIRIHVHDCQDCTNARTVYYNNADAKEDAFLL